MVDAPCILALQVHEFITLNVERRTEMKARLLLERFKVVVRSQVPTSSMTNIHRCVVSSYRGLLHNENHSPGLCPSVMLTLRKFLNNSVYYE